MTDLVAEVFAGTINPGQLVIERSIETADRDFDTAVFSGLRANYTILINGEEVDADATTLDIGDEDVLTVIHQVDDDGVLVPGPDGTDTLMHIERLQFSDQSLVRADLNAEPLGELQILDDETGVEIVTPAEDQVLRVSIANVTDDDNPNEGAITGAGCLHLAGRAASGYRRVDRHRHSHGGPAMFAPRE